MNHELDCDKNLYKKKRNRKIIKGSAKSSLHIHHQLYHRAYADEVYIVHTCGSTCARDNNYHAAASTGNL